MCDDPKVLLLKNSTVNCKFQSLLASQGFSTLVLSPIECVFCNKDLLFSKLCQLDKYSGLIFTSGIACDSVENVCMENSMLSSKFENHLAFAIGGSTRKKAHNLGFKCSGDDTIDSSTLLKHILEQNQLSGITKPLLFLCSNIRNDTIPLGLKENDIPFEELGTYTTQSSAVEPFLKESFANGRNLLAVGLFSPSGVRSCLNFLKQLPKSVSIICIGRTTGDCFLDLVGFSPYTCSLPSPECFAEVLRNSLS